MKSKLLHNTIIYTIGNLLSKIMGFIMLPVYTFYLTTEEFGRFDLFNSIVSVLVPFISLLLSEATFRYIIDEKDYLQTKKIITNSFVIIIFNIILASSALIIIMVFINYLDKEYVFWMLLTITNIMYIFFQNISRGLMKNKEYAISGILNAFLMVIFNITFLIILDLGYFGFILTNIFAFLGSIIYLVIVTKVYLYFNLNLVSKKIYGTLILYSAPLIPNFLSWWVINMSDRILITTYLDTEQNGLYAIGYRFANILFFAVSVFNLAWQESAILNFNSKDRNNYYSSIFNKYFSFLFSCILILIPSLVFVFNFIDKSYEKSLVILPILLYSVVFSALSSFFGTAFQSSKRTKESVSSSLIAAIINIIGNIILIPFFGIVGASISTLLSFLIMWIYRILQTRKYFTIRFEYKKMIVIILYNILFLFVYYFIQFQYSNYIMFLGSILIFITINKNLIYNLLTKFKYKSNKIRKGL